MDRCISCVPTCYRGTWVCEVCGYLCEAPKLPAVSFNPAVAPGSQKVVNVDPAKAAEAARALYVASLKGLSLRKQASSIWGLVDELNLGEYFE